MGLSGKNGSVKIGAGTFPMVNWSLDLATDMVDTSQSKTDWKSVVDGQTGVTGSVTLRADPSTPAQGVLIRAAIPPLALLDTEFLVTDTDGFTGKAYLSGFSGSTEAAGGVDLTFNVQISGALAVKGFPET